MNDSVTSNEEVILNDTEAEFEALKARARTMGISFSNNIGIDSLRKRVNAALNDTTDNEDDETEAVEKVASKPVETVMQRRKRIMDDSLAQVRVRIANLNPDKAALPGEFITVMNKYTGAITKYIPFGDATDNGYHVPKIIYDELLARKFQQIRIKKDGKGNEMPDTRLVSEYSVTVLEPLTEAELKELAAAQQAAARVNGE